MNNKFQTTLMHTLLVNLFRVHNIISPAQNTSEIVDLTLHLKSFQLCVSLSKRWINGFDRGILNTCNYGGFKIKKINLNSNFFRALSKQSIFQGKNILWSNGWWSLLRIVFKEFIACDLISRAYKNLKGRLCITVQVFKSKHCKTYFKEVGSIKYIFVIFGCRQGHIRSLLN